MRTTVIIPNYNGIKYMENCLASLQAQEKETFHTIVVDNGSTDGSKELVAEKFPEVQLIALPHNTGFCGAVNTGITASVTPYVLLLNNDTTADKEFVYRMSEAMQDERIFSVSARMLSMHEPDIIDDAGDLYCALGWAFARGKGKPHDTHYGTHIFAACGGAVIYRKKILDEIGLFDENHFAYLEDIDIGYRARIHGYQNRYEPQAVVYHAGSGFSGSRYNEFKIKLSSRNSIYLIYKNMPFLQILLNLPFLFVGFMIKWLFFVKKGYGMVYAKGLWQGCSLSASRQGRRHKVAFRGAFFRNYCIIQWELWKNIFIRAFSS